MVTNTLSRRIPLRYFNRTPTISSFYDHLCIYVEIYGHKWGHSLDMHIVILNMFFLCVPYTSFLLHSNVNYVRNNKPNNWETQTKWELGSSLRQIYLYLTDMDTALQVKRIDWRVSRVNWSCFLHTGSIFLLDNMFTPSKWIYWKGPVFIYLFTSLATFYHNIVSINLCYFGTVFSLELALVFIVFECDLGNVTDSIGSL